MKKKKKRSQIACRKENLSKHITENGSEQHTLLSFFNLSKSQKTQMREREYLEIEELEDVNGMGNKKG
jgi:hypothetical protein